MRPTLSKQFSFVVPISTLALLLTVCGGQNSHKTVDSSAGTPGSAVSSTTGGSSAELCFYLIVASSGAQKQQIHHQDKISQTLFDGDVTVLMKGPDTVKSMQFALDGNTTYHLDNSAPFTITAKDAAPFDPLKITAGPHMLTVEAYSATDGKGVLLESQTIVFNITTP